MNTGIVGFFDILGYQSSLEDNPDNAGRPQPLAPHSHSRQAANPTSPGVSVDTETESSSVR